MTTATAFKAPYECLFIVPPETAQDQVDVLVDKIKKIIADGNGTLRNVDLWGRRRLAYPIKHHKDGIYVYVDFDGGLDSAKLIDEMLRLNDLVIRYLTVEREDPPPPKEEKPGDGSVTPAVDEASASGELKEAAKVEEVPPTQS